MTTIVCAGLGIHNSLKAIQSLLKTEGPEGFEDLDEELSSNLEETESSVSLDGNSVEDAIKDDLGQ